jgi:outer membrane lipoprotein-sorting protein
LALLLALFAAGCAVSQKHAVAPAQIRPAQTATEQQLADEYSRQAEAVHSINAAVQMTPVAGSDYSGVIEEYHDVGGFVLAKAPDKIRVIGQAPVLNKNVFDMVSDGQTFHIFIPSKNKFLVGPTRLERPTDKPIENLRPQHIIDAIFWQPFPPGRQLLFEEAEIPPQRYYVLTLLRQSSTGLEIARKIWFDRADLSISRLEIYGPGGRLESDISYSDWQPSSATGNAAATQAAATDPAFPRKIHIRRPEEDYELTISITRLTLNPEIADDRFMLEQPTGTELVRLGTPAGAQP